MTDRELKNLLLFTFGAIVVITLLDTVIIRRHTFNYYLRLNIVECAIWASGYVAGNYFTLRKLKRGTKQ